MSLVDAIYEGLTDDEAFAAIPARLAAAADARSCMLEAFTPEGDPIFAAHNGYFTAESLQFYTAAGMHAHDPWRAAYRRLRLNRLSTSADLISTDDYARSIFYNELFRRFGDDTFHCLGGMVRHAGGSVALGMHRGAGSAAFDAAEVAALQPVMPHLTRLLQVRARLQAVAPRELAVSSVLDAWAQAVLILDQTARPVFLNRAAEALLAAGEVLTLRGGAVVAHAASTDERLRRLVSGATRRRDGHGGAFAIVGPTGTRLRIMVSSWPSGACTRALVLINSPDWADASLARTLSSLYGLTAAEADTVARVAEGATPAEVAEARGVGIATVRTQIEQARRKADARTITDLVRLAASLPKLRPPAG